MRRAGLIAAMMIMMPIACGEPVANAEDAEPARSFAACVARGGNVRRSGDEFLCRHITSYTMRTYLSGTTTCGEEVQYEIWDEIRSGTVTFAFAPQRVVQLPEVGETWRETSATPIPCVDPES